MPPAWWIRAVANMPGFSRPSAFAATASTVSARWSARRLGETKRMRGVERLAGVGIDGQRHRQTDLDQRDRLFGHRQLEAQRIDPDDRRDLRAAGDVVADADDALRDQAGERCPDAGVGDRLAGHRDARARGLERAVRLLRRVQRDLVLLPRRLDLRPALVVLALRDDLLIEQRPDAVELRLGVIERRLGVHDVGHLLRVERLVRASRPSRDSICAALASAS